MHNHNCAVSATPLTTDHGAAVAAVAAVAAASTPADSDLPDAFCTAKQDHFLFGSYPSPLPPLPEDAADTFPFGAAADSTAVPSPTGDGAVPADLFGPPPAASAASAASATSAPSAAPSAALAALAHQVDLAPIPRRHEAARALRRGGRRVTRLLTRLRLHAARLALRVVGVRRRSLLRAPPRPATALLGGQAARSAAGPRRCLGDVQRTCPGHVRDVCGPALGGVPPTLPEPGRTGARQPPAQAARRLGAGLRRSSAPVAVLATAARTRTMACHLREAAPPASAPHAAGARSPAARCTARAPPWSAAARQSAPRLRCTVRTARPSPRGLV